MKNKLTTMILKVIQVVWMLLKNILVNVCRRLVIMGRYSLICWQQQKMCRIYRRLGEGIFISLEEGHPEPLLQEKVKTQLDNLYRLKAQKVAQRQAISRIREKIKATSYTLPPRPTAELPSEAGPEESEET